ncbi:MAG: protoheme IX farnesyltransferase [Bacteroidales bacterium]|nr:protoheme IX farnesyltransferase [Bacteroidales bacterium]
MNYSNFKYQLQLLAQLSRFRLSMAVSFSAAMGYLLHGNSFGFEFVLLTAGVFFLASATSTLNQVQEYKLDALMGRTKNRPLPAGVLTVQKALMVVVIFTLIGSLLLLICGPIPLLLGLSNYLFYNILYTWLKQRSIYAVLPGAVVGAIPPLMGWTAAGGELLAPLAIFIAFFMFMWQMPHFWLLLLKYHKEYERAGFKSLTNTLSFTQIHRLIFIWIVSCSVSIMFLPLFVPGTPFAMIVGLILFNFFFVYLFYRFLFNEHSTSLKKAFITVNIYMSLFLILVVVFVTM